MTLPEFYQLLTRSGYPVFYHHWAKSKQYPQCPPPPFVAYLVPDEPNFLADGKTYAKIKDVQVELYMDKKDLSAEETLEGLFDEVGLPYIADTVWIESEMLYQKTYTLGLI